jgi:hypothetical protein
MGARSRRPVACCLLRDGRESTSGGERSYLRVELQRRTEAQRGGLGSEGGGEGLGDGGMDEDALGRDAPEMQVRWGQYDMRWHGVAWCGMVWHGVA